MVQVLRTFPELPNYEAEEVSKALQALLEGAHLVLRGATVTLVNLTGFVPIDFGEFGGSNFHTFFAPLVPFGPRTEHL